MRITRRVPRPSSCHLSQLTGCKESESAAFVLEGLVFVFVFKKLGD